MKHHSTILSMRWGEEKAMQQDPVEIARASYRAYVDKDRSAIETLIQTIFISLAHSITASIGRPISPAAGRIAR